MNIFWKQFISSFLIIFLVLFLFTILVIGELKKYDVSLIKQRLITTANLVGELLRPNLHTQDSEEIQRILSTLGNETEVRITVVTAEGRVLGDSTKSPAEMEKLTGRPEIIEALENNIGENARYSSAVQKEMLYVAVPLTDENDRVQTIIRTALPLSIIQKTLVPIEAKIIYLGIALTLLAALLSLAMSRTTTSSLSSIIKISDELAKGNLNVSIPVTNKKGEIPKITRALSHMAQKLNELFKQLSREKTQLEAVLSAMSEGVMVLSNGGKIIIMNNALKSMFHIVDNPERKPYWEVLRNREIIELIESVLESWTPGRRELIRLYPEERYYLANAIPLDSPDREIILVMFDITDFKRLENIKADFIANVSHELRTPLTAIKGYTETLEEEAYEDAEEHKHFLQIIDRHADRLINIVSDLLVLSEVESRDSPSENVSGDFESVDVNEIMKSTLETLKTRTGEKCHSVDMSRIDSAVRIRANRFLIEQMFINLIDNAIKYTPDKGSINLRSAVEGSNVHIEIEDTGIGIAKEHLPRIFERFYRVDKTRSRNMGGTGLGLSIVKHIVLMHGGKIDVESEEGKGSKFIITLPIG